MKPSARFGARLDGKTDKDRRPFKKDGAAPRASAAKKTFTKPWDEDRRPRAAAPAKADGFTKFRRPAPEDRAPLGAREQAGLPVERRSPPKERATASFEKRPYTPRTERAVNALRSSLGAMRARIGWRRVADWSQAAVCEAGFRGRCEAVCEETVHPSHGRGWSEAICETALYASNGRRVASGRPFKPRSFAGKEGGGKPFPKRPYKAREGGTRPFVKREFTPRIEASGGAESTVERTLPKRPYKPRAADAHTRPFY